MWTRQVRSSLRRRDGDPGNPIQLSDTDEDTFFPPPSLGQQDEEVFSTLEMTREDPKPLQKAGVIQV